MHINRKKKSGIPTSEAAEILLNAITKSHHFQKETVPNIILYAYETANSMMNYASINFSDNRLNLINPSEWGLIKQYINILKITNG